MDATDREQIQRLLKFNRQQLDQLYEACASARETLASARRTAVRSQELLAAIEGHQRRWWRGDPAAR